MRRAIISSAWSWPMTRWPRVSARFSTVCDLVLHHPADGNAGPVADHRGHRLLIDAGQNERRLALQRASCACSCVSSPSIAAPVRAPLRLLDRLAARAQLARSASICSTSSFSTAQRSSSSREALLLACELLARGRFARRGVDQPIGRLAADDLQLGLQRLRCGAGSPRPPAERRAG